MMTADDKRAHVAALYPGQGWKKKVAAMSEAQVFAIWAQHQRQQEQEQTPKPKNDKDDIPF